MIRITILCCACLAVCATAADISAGDAATAKDALAKRWFFVSKGLKVDEAVEQLKRLIDIAAAHGLNGMVLSADLDSIDTWAPEARERLKQVKAYCDEKKIDLIPLLMSAGYGSGISAQDPNLCEGLPVTNVLFEVKGNEASIVPDIPVSAEDGGFETHDGNKARGFDLQDEPGKVTFIDPKEVKQGQASLRMDFDGAPGNRVRLAKKLPMPNRHYVLRFWAKAAGLKPGRVSACIYDEGRQVSRMDFPLKDGADWVKFEVTVNTLDGNGTIVYLGAWEHKQGKLWLDGVELFEPGLVNVLNRPGTPLAVKKDGADEVLKEGTDYEKFIDKQMAIGKAYHTPAPLKTLPGGKIKDGDRLRVSYYTCFLTSLETRQSVLCMSEPKVYDLWKKVVAQVNDAIHPTQWFLDMDEIKGGDTCQACKARKNADGSPFTPAQILGDCITRQVQMIHAAAPKAEIAIWHDMLDPNANAKDRYFSVPGGYKGSWNHIPRELIIVPWLLNDRDKSIAHFSGLGHRIVAGAYYDADNLDGCGQWLTALAKSDKSIGIMYTTWVNKFDLLAPFGDLLGKRP
jgi:hypothetical protein